MKMLQCNGGGPRALALLALAAILTLASCKNASDSDDAANWKDDEKNSEIPADFRGIWESDDQTLTVEKGKITAENKSGKTGALTVGEYVVDGRISSESAEGCLTLYVIPCKKGGSAQTLFVGVSSAKKICVSTEKKSGYSDTDFAFSKKDASFDDDLLGTWKKDEANKIVVGENSVDATVGGTTYSYTLLSVVEQDGVLRLQCQKSGGGTLTIYAKLNGEKSALAYSTSSESDVKNAAEFPYIKQ